MEGVTNDRDCLISVTRPPKFRRCGKEISGFPVVDSTIGCGKGR
jgi:hypothetical protein